MKKRVLVVGNCSGDHSSIRQTLRQYFDVDVVRGFSADETMDLLGSDGPFDLVLVNRRLSSDGSDGVQLIRRIKADPRTKDSAVMLLSDYPDHQQAAVEAGALPGFGKSQLHRERRHVNRGQRSQTRSLAGGQEDAGGGRLRFSRLLHPLDHLPATASGSVVRD